MPGLWGGEALLLDGEAVGEISSAGWSDAAGRCVALGYVRGEAATRAHAGSADHGRPVGRGRRGIGVGLVEPRHRARRHGHARLVSCPRRRALSHLTVLDLTRVRAGPTAVRQLADWGAQVVKIEMPAALDEGEGVGGPREGSDFQNVHRNKRGMTLNLKSAEGVAILKKLVARADVLVENYRPDVKRKLGIDYETMARGQSAPRLRQHLGLRRGRPVSPAPRLRPDRAGHGRPDVDHRAAGAGAGARRHPDRRPLRRHLLRLRHRGRASSSARSRASGQWVKSSLLQAQLFMLDFQAARWLMKRRGRQAGRQQPPDVDPDRRLPDARRLHEPRRLGPQDLGAPVQRDRRARAGDASRLRDRRRCARSNRDLLHAEHRERTSPQRDTADWVELLNEAGVPSRADLLDRPGVRRIRRCSHLGIVAEGRRRRLPRPAGDAQPHAEPRRRASAGAGRAHRRGAARARLRRRRDRAAARADGIV